MTASTDAQAREAIRTSLDESLIVEAAAGTGKTSELVHRIVAVLAGGHTTVDRVVAVTFTRKAAGELKLRMRQELDVARRSTSASDEERAALEHAIAHLEEARVGTIHSFCAEILKERPVEARVDPDFDEMSEEEGRQLFGQVFRRWIHDKLEQPSPALRRALARPTAGPSDSPLERLLQAGWTLVTWRDFPKPWRREAFPRASRTAEIVEQLRALHEDHAAASRGNDPLRRSLESAATFVDAHDAMRLDRGPEPDLDELEGMLVGVLKTLKWDAIKTGRGAYARDRSRDEVIARRGEVIGALEAFVDDANADLAAALRDELWALVEIYEEVKRGAGKLDFTDLLLLARDLVRDDAEVRAHLQSRFSHIFVDEFQDTDPLQAELLMLLAADDPDQCDWTEATPAPGKLFVVGDPKQSIYRFRRADVMLYEAIKDRLDQRGMRVVELGQSWRSVAPIQSFVNQAFESAIQRDEASGSPSYVALSGGPEHLAEQPAVVALPIPDPLGKSGRATVAKVVAGEPPVVAAYIEWLLQESGWTVRDPEGSGRRVPLKPRHIAVLFRRFMYFGKDVTRPYAQQLEDRSIKHVLVGSRTFHQREEVETIRAALTAIEWPDDTLSVYATLRGTLFALRDDALLRYRERAGTLHPFAPRPEDLPEDLAAVAAALDTLTSLHRSRNFRPIVATVGALIESVRGHVAFAFRPAGDQVLANVQRVVDLARGYEASGGISFRGFVDRLNAEAERVRAGEAPVVEEGAEGVRLMTVHTAKGLEFPVVILADISARLAHTRAGRHLDPASGLAAVPLMGLSPLDLLQNEEQELARDEAEGLRLAYVAATRARDLLVVPAVGCERYSRWLGPVADALYPKDGAWREGSQAAGCPTFGSSTVMPSDDPGFNRGPPLSVVPGRYRLGAGGHDVVWWDPSRLRLAEEDRGGITRIALLSRDANPEAVEQAEREAEAWSRRRAASLARGGSRRFAPFNPSQSESGPKGQSWPIELVKLRRSPQRPRGRRFGTLVHVVMAHVPFNSDQEVVAALAELHGRSLGASVAEMKAAVKPVMQALKHWVIEEARQADRCHREMPFMVEVDESAGARGDRLEGDMDLVYRKDGVWTVVDYKTDEKLDEITDEYRVQVGWYLYAMHALTGEPVRGILLRV